MDIGDIASGANTAKPEPSAISVEMKAFYESVKKDKHVAMSARSMATEILSKDIKPTKKKMNAELLLKIIQDVEVATGHTYERMRAVYIDPYIK